MNLEREFEFERFKRTVQQMSESELTALIASFSLLVTEQFSAIAKLKNFPVTPVVYVSEKWSKVEIAISLFQTYHDNYDFLKSFQNVAVLF